MSRTGSTASKRRVIRKKARPRYRQRTVTYWTGVVMFDPLSYHNHGEWERRVIRWRVY
jgi:hypothetical protein